MCPPSENSGKRETVVTIRAFADADSEAMIGLVRELQWHEAQFFDRMKAPEEIGPWYVQSVLDACTKYEGIILLAEIGGEIAGYAVVLTSFSSEGMIDEVVYDYAMVIDLVVARPMRRLGIGKKLLEACEAHARAAGVRWLRISALAGNSDAIVTYQKFGFRDHLVTMEKPL